MSLSYPSIIKSLPKFSKPIYLDYQATTPTDPRVVEEMMPFLTEHFGNPHSITHEYGLFSKKAIDLSRERVADLIGARSPKDVLFTSGATESNNTAIKGLSWYFGKDKKPYIITQRTEHKCVLESCRFLEMQGWKVIYLDVDKYGRVDPAQLDATIREVGPDKVSVVSIMMVNNEIGTLQPVHEIGEICSSHGVMFHCDAAQAVGKMPVDVQKDHINLLSISGHKMYGPKGIGALYISRKPRVRLIPLMSGGGQERGIRSGTLAPALVVGMGSAAEIAGKEMAQDLAHVTRLGKKLRDGFTSKLEDVVLNGHPTERYPGSVNMSFSCVEGEALLAGLHDLAVSSGSACTSASLEPSYVLHALGVACTSASLEPSYVLHALGVSPELAHTSIRFSVGRFTTDEEIDKAIGDVTTSVKRLRELSPLWEMKQEGIDISKINWTMH
ncbi:Cysteine desulfurase, mitochondrial [Aduncisulcus paluster]|uniref:Cysteine desulfurase, mitochondrial n=1 Tax=Aduncisulcus paluster TaxID=2918883 RepID=A0ABQ5KGH3_9EUKA|nr:Cysteine desulfurase, mitochondrial [Aduncisulcus paluster]